VTCLRIPRELVEAEAIIAGCVGTTDWRGDFLLGLATVVLAAALLVGLALTLRAVR
jgi:hypothetical protein